MRFAKVPTMRHPFGGRWWFAGSLLAIACGGRTLTDANGGSGDSSGAGGNAGAGSSTSSAGTSGSSATSSTSGTGGSSVSVGTGGVGGFAGAGGYGGSAMTGGSGGVGGSCGADALSGSYDLVFQTVLSKVVPGMAPTPPSKGANMRVDVQSSPAGYQALVTPRWGTPMPYTFGERGADVVLGGDATISGGTVGAITDRWTTLRLDIGTCGAFSGTANGSGDESIVDGDVVRSGGLVGTGTIRPDTTPPEIRSETTSPILPPGQNLPWERVTIRAAEGIDGMSLRTGLDVRRKDALPGAPQLPFNWTIRSINVWGGDDSVYGSAESWGAVDGAAMIISVPAAYVIDRASNRMKADFFSGFSYLPLGAPMGGFLVEGAQAALPAHWGDVLVHSLEPSADCEAGACVVLGPFPNGICNVGRTGVAGRLRFSAAKAAVRVRYRVIMSLTPGSMPANGPAPFSIDVAAPGADTATTTVPMPMVRNVGGGELYQSDFLDVVAPSVDLTTPASEFGFAIYAGTRSTIGCGGGGPLPPPVKTQVVIDKITIEPR